MINLNSYEISENTVQQNLHIVSCARRSARGVFYRIFRIRTIYCDIADS